MGWVAEPGAVSTRARTVVARTSSVATSVARRLRPRSSYKVLNERVRERNGQYQRTAHRATAAARVRRGRSSSEVFRRDNRSRSKSRPITVPSTTLARSLTEPHDATDDFADAVGNGRCVSAVTHRPVESWRRPVSRDENLADEERCRAITACDPRRSPRGDRRFHERSRQSARPAKSTVHTLDRRSAPERPRRASACEFAITVRTDHGTHIGASAVTTWRSNNDLRYPPTAGRRRPRRSVAARTAANRRRRANSREPPYRCRSQAGEGRGFGVQGIDQLEPCSLTCAIS